MLADASRRLSCDAARDSFFCLKHTNIRARLPALPRLIFWARCSAAALSTVARRPAAASPHCLTQGVGRWHATRLSSVSRRPAALSLKSNTLLLKNGLGEEGASGLTATDSHVWAEHRRQSDVTPSPPDTTPSYPLPLPLPLRVTLPPRSYPHAEVSTCRSSPPERRCRRRRPPRAAVRGAAIHAVADARRL